MKYLILLLFLIPSSIANAQSVDIATQDISNKQSDIVQQNQYITNSNTIITQNNNQNTFQQSVIVKAQAQIVADNNAISNDNQIIANINSNTAQTASGVNWDYFVTLEPQIPFSTWSKVDNGINWTSIIPTLGISCGGITEANVNWTNWGNCEAHGMTPGSAFGGYATGIASFWCGNGKINGTC